MRALAGTVVGVSLVVWPVTAVAGAAAPAAPPVRAVTVTGTGTSTYPAYADDVARFGVRTVAETDGALVVTAASTDPGARVLVDGRPAEPGAQVPVTGLDPGDEVNVQIADSGGTTNQSFVYLPAGFPALAAASSGDGPSPGMVFLTLVPRTGGPRFETVVDHHGVPAYVRETLNPHDLKRQPNGHYTVARGETLDLMSSFEIVELDERFEPVASHVTTDLVMTDFHDSILLPDGGRILMSYEPNADTGLIDSIVEEVDASGEVVLTWTSEGNVDPALDTLTAPFGDYAHLNSVDVMQDGNLLLSFRHTSQVMKVDRQTGAVLWRLGGPRSDFTFPDDELGGPCAQHTARELANGDIQIFDNGSKVTPTTLDPMCPDPADPTGDRVQRPSTRVTVYRLDETAMTAQLVDSVPTGSFSEFAGSAQRLGGESATDNLLVGTSASTSPGSPDVLEVDAGGDVVWSLDTTDDQHFSYRAAKFPAPDARDPVVELAGDGATYVEGEVPAAAYGCSDAGGSNLAACTGTVASGAPLAGSPGRHVLQVTATDGAGNSTTRQVRYTVLPRHRPDLQVRRPGSTWVGVGAHDGVGGQTVQVPARTGVHRARIRVVNDGVVRDRFVVKGTRKRGVRVRYVVGGRDVTARVRSGRYRTPLLDPGERWSMTVRLDVGARATARTLVRVRATSVGNPSRTDAVSATRRR